MQDNDNVKGEGLDSRIEKLITSAKRREEYLAEAAAKHSRESRGPRRRERPGRLGLTPSEFEFVQSIAWTSLFEEAKVSARTFNDWWPRLRGATTLDEDTAECLTVDLTRDYAKAIELAATRFIDLLMQAALARGGGRPHADLRTLLWKLGLRFAGTLGDWEVFCCWFVRVDELGMKGRVSSGPSKEALERRRRYFERRINLYWHDWLTAIDRRIELRSILSSKHIRKISNQDKLQTLLRQSRETYPNKSLREIAGRVDGFFSKANDPVPIPKSWRQAGCTSLVEAYDNPKTHNRTKKYLSEVTRVTPNVA
jgi:hypothetical protein